jgi:glycosyltransferase involved in cell wall biosynthesis
VTILDRFITDAERDALLAEADAVILPYRRGYQSGVMIMAMSYGKVVIASDLASHREVIRHGVNGLLFPSEDFRALADLLQGWAGHRYDSRRIGQEAIRTMEEAHGCQAVNQLFSKIITP